MVEQGIGRAGAVKPAAAATAAVARRARLEGAGPVDHHRSRNESAAGRPRSPRPGSWFDASPDCSLRTGCAFPRPHEPRSHPATRSAASPHIRSGVGHPHHNPSCTRARGSGRAGSFSETGILQPWGPTTTARPDPRNRLETGSRTGYRLRFSSSRRPPPGQCPAWQTATARSEAFARQQRSRSAGCGRAGSQRTRQTSG